MLSRRLEVCRSQASLRVRPRGRQVLIRLLKLIDRSLHAVGGVDELLLLGAQFLDDFVMCFRRVAQGASVGAELA